MTPDPRFLFLTAAHREALAGLVYAIVNRKGIVVLSGDAGTGKTTLLRVVVDSMPANLAQFGLILNPALTRAEFLELAMLEFGLPEIPPNKAKRLVQFHEFLLRNHAEGKLAVLFVDEAHRLSANVLEEIRLLSNFETAEGRLLQIVLAAQGELDYLLSQPGLRQLRQRIAHRFVVKPLSPAQIGPYLEWRWRQAGAACELPFSRDSIDYLELFSGGIPRVINAICDNALLLAFSEGRGSVWPEHIVTAVKELVLYEADAQPDSEAPCASEALSQANGALAWGAAVASEPPIPMPTLARYRALARTSRLRQSREKSS